VTSSTRWLHSTTLDRTTSTEGLWCGIFYKGISVNTRILCVGRNWTEALLWRHLRVEQVIGKAIRILDRVHRFRAQGTYLFTRVDVRSKSVTNGLSRKGRSLK